MTDTDIHSCGYYCDRPLCIKAQRDELRNKMFSDQAIKTYSGGKSNYTHPDEALMKRVMDGIPDMPIKVQDKRFDKFKSFEEFAQSFAQSAQVIGIPKKEWVGLTLEELEFYTEELGQGELGRGVLRAVDDFLKEKNNV
jgi:hypothetical protein